MNDSNSTTNESVESTGPLNGGGCAKDDSDDEYNSDNEDFYFESDHLALRGNPDYRIALRTIIILEAQRIEAAKHIDQIAEVKRQALRDPEGFIKTLASGESLDVPGPINIQNVSKSHEIFNLIRSKRNILFLLSASKNKIRKV